MYDQFFYKLLLKEYKKIPKYFKNRKLFYEWENWCHKNNISKIQCCVNFISNQKYRQNSSGAKFN